MSRLPKFLCAAAAALAFSGAELDLAATPVVHGEPPVPRVQRIANAITELDVDKARALLEQGEVESSALNFERARLAVYTGDCDAAQTILSSPSFSGSPEAASLGELAKTCARATAGSVLVKDDAHALWIRLQDDADQVLVPFIADVAVRARAAMMNDFGIELPRPLRIDLVRDLFSLSAVSGLPLSAAETTGTVAVARWGRVTMLSPRATTLGYQWEDTLAHEITHLVLSRATRDRAPLWLQEGMAKRQEIRWRAPRPFDNTPEADAVAHDALVTGNAIGIDKLGASIAMLPTPEAATTAFAEVTSFMSYFIRQKGGPALKLLLTDLKGTESNDANQALRSVTGYDLPSWIALWEKWLLDERGHTLPKASAKPVHGLPGQTGKDPSPAAELARRVRLGDLLLAQGLPEAAAKELEPAVPLAVNEPAVRWRAARALAISGEAERARHALGSEADITSMHGAWFALHGRFLREAGDEAAANRAFELGIAADPLLEDVACEGYRRSQARGARVSVSAPPLPKDRPRQKLCEAARAVPRD